MYKEKDSHDEREFPGSPVHSKMGIQMRLKMVKLICFYCQWYFTGCASFSTYQSPEVLKPAEKVLGMDF